MRLGLDFDNTIVSYDGVFHAVAVRQGLIAAGVGTGKDAVRDHLRALGREDDWTGLQGAVYGAGMELARPWPGVVAFCRRAVILGIPLFIVSHKTRHPFRGPRHDLHAAARGWLQAHGFFDPAVVGLASDAVFLEPTKEDKLTRIGALGCSHFIDDLPELLAEPAFPQGVARILFDPADAHPDIAGRHRYRHWAAIAADLLDRPGHGPD